MFIARTFFINKKTRLHQYSLVMSGFACECSNNPVIY
ncbi:putative hypothetical, partial [Escherichia coli P0304777.5]